MPIEKKLTEDDARQALRDHVLSKAFAAREVYGPVNTRAKIERLLNDPEVTRWPTVLRFDETGLRAGEFGFAAPLPSSTEGEWAITLHPRYEADEAAIVALASYHIVTVNYGEIATHEEAELFGAMLLGLVVEEYYERVCSFADRTDEEASFTSR